MSVVVARIPDRENPIAKSDHCVVYRSVVYQQ